MNHKRVTFTAALAVGLTGLGVAAADQAKAATATYTVIGHRGVGDDTVVENSKAAIKAGFKAGAVGVEVDVRLTRDGQPVIMHDSTMARVSNCDDGRTVESMTYAQFRACYLDNGETPLNVYEAAWKTKEHGGTSGQLWLHLKIYKPDSTVRAKIMKAVDKYGLRKRTVIMGDEYETLNAFRKWSDLQYAHIFNAEDLDDAQEGWSSPYTTLVPYRVPVTPALVAAAHKRGQRVLAVEDNWQTVADVIDLGLDGVLANDVAQAVEDLQETA